MMKKGIVSSTCAVAMCGGERFDRKAWRAVEEGVESFEEDWGFRFFEELVVKERGRLSSVRDRSLF
jgi:hypothetical protein